MTHLPSQLSMWWATCLMISRSITMTKSERLLWRLLTDGRALSLMFLKEQVECHQLCGWFLTWSWENFTWWLRLARESWRLCLEFVLVSRKGWQLDEVVRWTSQGQCWHSNHQFLPVWTNFVVGLCFCPCMMSHCRACLFRSLVFCVWWCCCEWQGMTSFPSCFPGNSRLTMVKNPCWHDQKSPRFQVPLEGWPQNLHGSNKRGKHLPDN